MKVIFLDIDGVMSSIRSTRMDDFSQEAVAALNTMLRNTDARIVLSTSWREIYDDKNLEYILTYNGVDANKVIGHTPILYAGIFRGKDPDIRGKEIHLWLEKHGKNASGICILDDKPQMGYMSPWLLLTKSFNGLLKSDASKGVTLLNKPFSLKDVRPF